MFCFSLVLLYQGDLCKFFADFQVFEKFFEIFLNLKPFDSAVDEAFLFEAVSKGGTGCSASLLCVSLCCDYSIANRPLQLLCKDRGILKNF